MIGFVHSYKTESLKQLIKDKAPMVRSIRDAGETEVFDFSLDDDTHWGVIGSGLIAHNCEIALNPNQFCNLTTINQTGIRNEKDFLNRVYAATLVGTLQASYTSFDYLRPVWQNTTEREALLGVSFTGIADNAGIVTPELLQKGAALALEVNEKYARKLGINLAARIATVKPEGSASCVVGSSSGIHARHADHYIRRVRMNKDDALAVYLKAAIPDLVEDDMFSSTGVVVSIPQESPKGAITRHQETALSLLDRVLMYRKNWIEPTHRSGLNKHNVSVTISVQEHEWDDLREEMWKHRDSYSGISLLPFDNGSYQQAPFEDCTKEKYEEMAKLVKEIDLRLVKEEVDNTSRIETLACQGGNCEIT
jgi:ribonucleoside-diphosphate reductase alpha chain